MTSKKKYFNLKINPGALSSRFLVDLKKDSAEQPLDVRHPGDIGRLEEKLEKLAEINYKEIAKKGSDKIKNSARDFWIPAIAGMTKKVKAVKPEITSLSAGRRIARNDNSIVNQLAFVGLAKFLMLLVSTCFRMCYKICYALGWAIVFTVRFFYFLLLKLAGPPKKIFIILFLKFSRLFKDLPSGYQATQAVALSVSAKIFKKLDGRAKAVSLPPPAYPGINAYLKPVLIFSAVLLLMILPVKAFTYYQSLGQLKGKVLGASESALESLFTAGRAAAGLDFNQAGKDFALAGDNFLSAQRQLSEINGLIFALASLAPDKNIQLAASGKNIAKAGELASSAGKNLSLAMSGIFQNKENRTGEVLVNLSDYGHLAIIDLVNLDSELKQINGQALPAEYQTDFILLKQKISLLAAGLNEFVSLVDGLRGFLGESLDKRYLLVFQNNAELRASGGFIGSYAIIDFSRGEIKNIEAPGGGSYDTDAGLLKKIKSPEPLRLIRPDWHFWDANWWPDWPSTARQLAWFYENSGGSTVDGVISFTPTVVERLLEITGPVDMSEQYGLIFSADNFWLETQKLSERKPDITREPKKIIGDLMNKLIEELPRRLTKDNLGPLLKIAERSLADKNIMFYFSDQELQNKISELGWDGRLKDTDGDYLSVINTNIAGGKSDRKIKQEVTHRARILPDGGIVDEVTIKRAHEGINHEPFIGVRNVNWLRVYVPAGSKLITAEGFKPVDEIFFKQADENWEDNPAVAAAEANAFTDQDSGTKIYSELGKTVFANWSQLDPGETEVITLKYLLPFKLTDQDERPDPGWADWLIERAGAMLNPGQKNLYSYSLLAQKQPGMNSSDFKSELELSANFKIAWQYGGPAEPENFNRDITAAAVLQTY
ncbi:MAG: DUF4012 domain-containing protein [bacterium]|nr:DUF4012 domain-containing protein [bacterium]